jgi:nitrate reductase gamma subunit
MSTLEMHATGRGEGGVALATAMGALVATLLAAGIYFGSRRFKDFDTALVPYAAASVFSAFGVAYRYTIWLSRPPTRRYWWRSWQLFLAPRDLLRNLVRFAGLVRDNLLAQKFIERRSPLRWATHALIFWGCILAGAVTFPLSFGWIRFETPRDSQGAYDAYLFGVSLFRFSLTRWLAPLVFNVLDVAAILVIAGVALAVLRRTRDRGAIAVQQFANDLLPLLLLFAISASGILLTVSTHFLGGFQYTFLSQFHAITVIFTLLYLPFGKFFHIFQRPAQLAIDFYKRAGAQGAAAPCTRCGEPFAAALHVQDLKDVQRELSICYELPNGAHYQDVCPPCRRKNLALLQDEMWRGPRAQKGT